MNALILLLALVIPGDINGDGSVNTLDADVFAAALIQGNPAADCNGDGAVNGLDADAFRELLVKAAQEAPAPVPQTQPASQPVAQDLGITERRIIEVDGPVVIKDRRQVAIRDVQYVITMTEQEDAAVSIIGSDAVVLDNVGVTIRGPAPKVGLLLARNPDAGSAGRHDLRRVDIEGPFRVASHVNIGSECVRIDNCGFNSWGKGSSAVIVTGYNEWGFEGIASANPRSAISMCDVTIANSTLRVSAQNGGETLIRIKPRAFHVRIVNNCLTVKGEYGAMQPNGHRERREYARSVICIGDGADSYGVHTVIIRDNYGETFEAESAIEAHGRIRSLIVEGNRLQYAASAWDLSEATINQRAIRDNTMESARW